MHMGSQQGWYTTSQTDCCQHRCEDTILHTFSAVLRRKSVESTQREQFDYTCAVDTVLTRKPFHHQLGSEGIPANKSGNNYDHSRGLPLSPPD